MADDQLEELLTLREVLRAEGCGRSTLYLRMSRGDFPSPIPNPGGLSPNLWRKSEVVKHQRERFARLDKLAKRGEKRESRLAPSGVAAERAKPAQSPAMHAAKAGDE